MQAQSYLTLLRDNLYAQVVFVLLDTIKLHYFWKHCSTHIPVPIKTNT